MPRPLTSADHICAVRIAGIGPAPGLNTATAWASVGSQRMITALELDAEGWIADCLMELPQTVERSVDPWSSRYETGPMSFELDLARVGYQIPVQAWQPVTNLAADALEDDSTVKLERGDLDGALLYVNGETIYVTSPSDLGGGVWQYSASRGYNGSLAEEHGAGDPLYTAPPEWRGRKVEFLVINGAGSGRIRWTGYLDTLATSGTGTRVVVGGREILDALGSRQINQGAPNLSQTGQILWDRLSGYLVGSLAYERRVRKRSQTGGRICFQAGEGLITLPYNAGALDFDAAVFELGTVYGEGTPDRVALGDDPARFVAVDKPICELFVVSQELDALYGGGVSATWDLGEGLRYHPVAIAWALISATSRYTTLADPVEPDVLRDHWGVALYDWTDHDRWYSVIAATPEVQIDQLYLGWDGAPVDVLDVIIDVLLRPYGFFLAISEDGRLGVSRLISPTIADLCDGATRQLPLVRPSSGGQLEWDYAIGSAVRQVTANVGATPWLPDPSTLTISDSSRIPRGASFADSRVYTYDLRTVSRGRVSGLFDGDSGDGTTARVLDKAIRASWALPRLKITALDSRQLAGNVKYDLGTYVTLAAPIPDAPIFRLPDGSLADLTSEADQVYFLGQILAARQNVPNQTYELELLLVAWRTGKVARFRAPSAVVVGWVDVDAEIEIEVVSEFGGSDTDAAGFAPGDEVELWELDGTATAEGVRTVTAVNAELISMDGVYSDPVGKVMRLAASTSYSNTGNAVGVTCSDRPWVYLADDDDEITTYAGTETADVYG
jgi:hypothetical protein